MPPFVAQSVTRSHTIHLPANPSHVFPLFSPLGEKQWEPDWEPRMLYPASGNAQPGTVFTTQHPGESERVWTIISYDHERATISYLQVMPTSHVTRIDIACAPVGPQASSASVTYTLTALTPHGNAHIERFTEAAYQTMINGWEAAITRCLLGGAQGQAPRYPQA